MAMISRKAVIDISRASSEKIQFSQVGLIERSERKSVGKAAASSLASAASCIARGMALFGDTGVETGLIRETLGEFPLIGFFANGEISRDRLYGHTGVLTLFT